jgi:cobyrinic acid a,c-diamide synthase
MTHIYLSASHKSSGKTSLAIGLLAAFAERGLAVQPFKKGPGLYRPDVAEARRRASLLQPRLQHAR